MGEHIGGFVTVPTISIAMIVKNEEAVLERCLASFAAHVDEIVIVDTGSTDATKDIARRYTNRIFDFAWCDDFSAARQYAFDRARSLWVAWVDADDVMTGAEHLRNDLALAGEDVGSIHWRYVYGRDAWGNTTLEYWRERCVRTKGGYRWSGRVHETLTSSQPGHKLESQHVSLEHRPKPELAERKQGRNLRIIEQECRAAGDSVSPRLLFYLGNEYSDAGDYDAAIDAYQRYLKVGFWDDELYLAHLRLAGLYRARDRFDTAIDIALAALKLHPDWPHAYFDLARSYYFRQDWAKVIHWTDLGRQMAAPTTAHFMNPLDWLYHWMICYTNALYRTGRLTEAYTWTKQALELCPGDLQHTHNLAFFSKAIDERLLASLQDPA